MYMQCRRPGFDPWVGRWGTVVKNLPANAGDSRDAGSTPGSGRFHGVENGNPLPYSRLGNSMDRGTWQAAVHEVIKLSDMI